MTSYLGTAGSSPPGSGFRRTTSKGFLGAVVLGLGAGLLSVYLVTASAGTNPDYATTAGRSGWGLRRLPVLLVRTGFSVPVTHHMTPAST